MPMPTCLSCLSGGLERYTTTTVVTASAMTTNPTTMCALGRIGTPEEVASIALYLSSDEASFLNGTVVVCDGGQSL